MKDGTEENTSRREVLKKAGKGATFIAPVIMSFKVSEIKAQVSFLSDPPAPPW